MWYSSKHGSTHNAVWQSGHQNLVSFRVFFGFRELFEHTRQTLYTLVFDVGGIAFGKWRPVKRFASSLDFVARAVCCTVIRGYFSRVCFLSSNWESARGGILPVIQTTVATFVHHYHINVFLLGLNYFMTLKKIPKN